MRHTVTIIALLIAIQVTAAESPRTFGGLQMLDGYSAQRGSAVDATVWTIHGKRGLTIHFESGPSEGPAVKSREKDKYVFYREQTVNGYKVLVALIKPGVKTDPDLDSERDLPPGNILLVTFILSGHRDHTANFVAKVANQEEMVDALLMVLTFNPSKGSF